MPVDFNKIEHLSPGKQSDRTFIDLPHKRPVGAEKELLTGLSTGIECSRDLSSSERPLCKYSSIFTGERHTLGNALVDDAGADFRKPVNVVFPRPKIAAFDRVVKEPPHAVTVNLVLTRRIDAALSGDTMRSSWRILYTKTLNIVA